MSTPKKRKSVKIIDDNFPEKVDSLQNKIGYKFRDISFLIHALTHKSAIVSENDPNGLSSNERLECLGDSILDFLVVEELFARSPKLTEGQITKIKSLIVSRKIIGQIAEKIDLQNTLILGKSCKNLKNSHTDIASNAFEALIAAIYLDGSIKEVHNIFQKFLFPFIDEFAEEKDNINYKSLILEFVQSKKFPPTKYTILSESGPDHNKVFKVEIEINGEKMGEASGNSKKDAEQKAAKIAAGKLNLV